MKQRWLPVAVLTGILFAINAIARLIVWQADLAEESEQTRIGLIAFSAIGVVFIAAAAWRAVKHPLSRVVADLLVAGAVGCLLSVIVGPFFGGSRPFMEGVGFFLGQIVQYAVLGTAGAVLGVLVVIALGRDWKTQALKKREAEWRVRGRRSARSSR